jgi:glycosyltransferase involved in cell wall biosynthesis
MRLVHLNPDPGIQPGKHKGAAVHVQAMREAFCELGQQVLAMDAPDDAGVEVLLERARSEAPLDLIYERHALARHAGARFARRHGIPHVLEVNAPLAAEERRHRGAALAHHDLEEERIDFRQATLVLCVSGAVARYAEELGARPERILIRPNAVDPRRFHPRPAEDTLRDALVPTGRIAIGFHGRLRPWHRIDVIARMVARLLEEQAPVHLLTLGEGEFASVITPLVPQAAWTHVPWAEHERAARIVACFDLLPMYYDPGVEHYFSPLKLAEGMAAGVVPIVPRLGDLPQAVEHGVDGWLYPAGDEAALFAALRQLIGEPDLRARLAAGAITRAQGNTWTAIARDVLQALGRPRR